MRARVQLASCDRFPCAKNSKPMKIPSPQDLKKSKETLKIPYTYTVEFSVSPSSLPPSPPSPPSPPLTSLPSLHLPPSPPPSSLHFTSPPSLPPSLHLTSPPSLPPLTSPPSPHLTSLPSPPSPHLPPTPPADG